VAGARVIICVKVLQNNIYLLRLYDKLEKDVVGNNELSILLKAAGLL
jgi:hypothetical protein